MNELCKIGDHAVGLFSFDGANSIVRAKENVLRSDLDYPFNHCPDCGTKIKEEADRSDAP